MQLTILSSLKTLGDDFHSDCQVMAVESWKALKGEVVLFNNYPNVASRQIKRPYSLVTPSQNPPTIKEMLKWYAPHSANASDGVVILVNGDIVLTENAGKVVKINESLGRIWAATSFRHETHLGRDYGVVDEGLDFFAMSRTLAARMADDIPDFLTLGRGVWDNWVNGWLWKNLPTHRYFDITDWACVLHPRHEREPGRLSGYTEEQTKQALNHDRILARGIPKIKYVKP